MARNRGRRVHVNPRDDRTARDVIEHALERLQRRHGTESWARATLAAFANPHAGIEAGIVRLIYALAEYADGYADELGGAVGEDHVLGDDGWWEIARGVKVLLNGPTHRIDAGTVDGLLRDMADSQGCEGEI